ncbi:tyrosine-type recombinase/integrase [Labrenzia sp. DG1229]|uniref:tyrosine-type recombinase/integrase n=1 Tax=Labrenzia sp. DG1229 TaxID=681847 RepID=UPI00056BE6A9|nr:tyrosine-type recombinase/integrase [Labrenzia sp. DG1229]
MLQHLFNRALPRLKASAHARDLDAFANFLLAENYSRLTCRRHVRHLSRVLDQATREPIGRVSGTELRTFFKDWPGKGHRGTERLYRRFLANSDRLIADYDDEPRFTLKRRYLERLRKLRGLAPRTLTHIDWALTHFLTNCLAPDDTEATLTTKVVENYFRIRRPQLARPTFQHIVGSVRRFLRYGYECGEILEALHQFELPRSFRFEQPPRAVPWEQIEALLVAIDRTTFVGNRDYAMLHLMAFYGLRPGEVAALTTNAVEWRNGTLTVYQPKTRSTLLLPLAPATVAILHDHARQRRTSPHPEFFLCGQAPYGPLSCSVVSTRFKLQARRAGLPIAEASAYTLRHSFAMRLLAGGVGIEAIGDLMGHRNVSSTSAYLRIQSDMLRSVGLEVPGREVQP